MVKVSKKRAETQEGEPIYSSLEKVKFKVGYKRNFKGKKYLKEGSVIIQHPLAAQALQRRGYGTIITDDAY